MSVIYQKITHLLALKYSDMPLQERVNVQQYDRMEHKYCESLYQK